MTTGTDDSEAFSLRREFELRRNAGRVLAAALARLIEAYESCPDRARHALSWEHLPGRVGSPSPISERDEASAGKASDSAKQVVQTSILHDGVAPLSEYSQLLDDWNLISDRGEEESFKLDEYLGSNHSNWEVTGEGLTPSEKRRLQGWRMEDVERLRSRDPELLSEYRRELENAALAQKLGGKDREIWVEARLADIDSAVESKILGARVNDLDVVFSKWRKIEEQRIFAANQGRTWEWFETPEDSRPERPVQDERKFPDSLTSEMRSLYETTKQTQDQLWLTRSREHVDEYEALVGQLVALSKELPTTPEIAREMARREKHRAEFYNRFGPRVPIPTDYGWYEYCSLAMEDEADFDREIEDDVRRSGNLWIHWAKELVGMLPAITRRAVEFGKHPISDIPKVRVPESLSVLFEQAHLAYLFDFDIPCVLTCGALVEEAFKERFNEMFEDWDRQFSEAKRKYKEAKMKSNALKESEQKPQGLAFWEKIDKVVDQNPSAAPARQLANRIWGARTQAMHHPEDYLRQVKYKSRDVLFDTRKVLQFLFEPEQTQEGRT
jgi:hypothetical protein